MINVHKRLTDAFDTLPLIEGKKPNYKWGDELHLNQIMKLYNKDKMNPYPLIYNISNTNDQNSRRNTATYKSLSLILATRNPHTEYHNSQRWATSYNNILFPLAKNIEQLFKKSQVFLWDGEWTPYEFPNYGNNTKNETTDIWDALRFDTRITINDKCLTKIFYDI